MLANGGWVLSENARLPRNIQGSFTCRISTTCDRRLYFPSEGRRAEDSFALKNLTASVGFEPAELVYQRPARYLYTTEAYQQLIILHLFIRNDTKQHFIIHGTFRI